MFVKSLPFLFFLVYLKAKKLNSAVFIYDRDTEIETETNREGMTKFKNFEQLFSEFKNYGLLITFT